MCRFERELEVCVFASLCKLSDKEPDIIPRVLEGRARLQIVDERHTTRDELDELIEEMDIFFMNLSIDLRNNVMKIVRLHIGEDGIRALVLNQARLELVEKSPQQEVVTT